MKRILLLFTAAALVAMGLVASPAWADLDTTDPGRELPGEPADADCWGEVVSDVASPLFGLHSSNPDPRDEDRIRHVRASGTSLCSLQKRAETLVQVST